MKKLSVALILLAGCHFTPHHVFGPLPLTEQAVKTPIPAIGNLGMAEYAKVARDNHPRGFGNVTFTNVKGFGDAYDSINDILATGKVSVQEYNLMWKDNHSFSRADFPTIINEAKKYVTLVNSYPAVGCIFSGGTEHNYRVRDATDLANAILSVIPARCIYSNNPWVGHGSFITPGPRIWNEVHGWPAKKPNVGGRYIHSMDGTSAFDVNYTEVKKAFLDAEMEVVWDYMNNGLKNRNDKTPRSQRVSYPNSDLINMEAFLFTKQGDVELPRNYLVKPKSDPHQNPPEPRALKPVFIFPYSGNVIELRAAGIKIITSEVAQKFADGRYRYYFKLPGYKIAANAGTSVFGVYAGNKRLGKANPGFRQGN